MKERLFHIHNMLLVGVLMMSHVKHTNTRRLNLTIVSQSTRTVQMQRDKQLNRMTVVSFIKKVVFYLSKILY